MRRRDLLVLPGALAAVQPLVARAQQKAMPVIGYLTGYSPGAPGGEVASFRDGLNEAGFAEDRNVTIEYRWAEGQYERLPAFAAELVGRKVDVIYALALPAALAARAATSTIPIVFSIGVDPVAFGLVKSLNRPDGNITGVTALFDLLWEKRLQLIHELVPAASIGFLINPKNQNAASHRAHVETAAQALSVKVIALEASSADEFEPAFATGRQKGIGALLAGDDPLMISRAEQLMALAAGYRLPAIYDRRDFVVAGGLISYGPNNAETRRQAGIYVARILKGAKPADLPVFQPTKFELVINLKASKALGLTVPQSILARADEAIE